jgi:hypothetical protein
MAFILGSIAAVTLIYLSLRFPRIRTAALIFLGLLALLAVFVAATIYFDPR